jgi:hypothetical protein
VFIFKPGTVLCKFAVGSPEGGYLMDEKVRSEENISDEDTALQASESDDEIIDLVEEVSDADAEDNDEIIELTEGIEETPSEDITPPLAATTEDVEEAPEYKALDEDFLAGLSASAEPDAEQASEAVAKAKEAEVNREMISSQFSKEELEALITRAARDVISEMAERIIIEVAEKAIVEEIEKIKSALR